MAPGNHPPPKPRPPPQPPRPQPPPCPHPPCPPQRAWTTSVDAAVFTAAMFVGNGPAAAVKAPVVKAPAATPAAIAALRRILIPGPFLLATPGAPFGRPGERTNNLRTAGLVPVAQALAAGGRTRSSRQVRGAGTANESEQARRAGLLVVVVGILDGLVLVENAEGRRPEISLIAVDPIDQD